MHRPPSGSLRLIHSDLETELRNRLLRCGSDSIMVLYNVRQALQYAIDLNIQPPHHRLASWNAMYHSS
jgi:hypothetical protein